MKILIVSVTDIQGGAGKAAYRLHNSLLEADIDSTMLVQRKKSLDHTVIGPSNKLKQIIGFLRPYIDNFPLKLLYRRKTRTMFSISWLPFSSIASEINKINPDIVHIHWIGSGMLNLSDISKIKAPMVWSLHDMWLFTGGCHYNEGCDKYLKNCGGCKVLSSSNDTDLSRKLFNKKLKIFSNIKKMYIVATSRWTYEYSSRSPLLENHKHSIIPNPINTKLYLPHNKKNSRKKIGLKASSKLILFAADPNDKRKGFIDLISALSNINSVELECVVLGNKNLLIADTKFKIHYLGHVNDENKMIDIYNSADVLVAPSLQETFGLNAVESMACGTPVVATRNTGLADIVNHKVNGYLFNQNDVTDLKRGIEWVLSNSNYQSLCQKATERVNNNFSNSIVSKKYIELYSSIIHEKLV